MIVQPSDFAVPNSRFVIPNVLLGPGQWNAFIDEREAYILGVVFGSKFYKDFVDGLAALPALWVATADYTTGNEVSYAGSSWTAVDDNTGEVPEVGNAHWTKGDDDPLLMLRDGSPYDYNDKGYTYGGLKEMLLPYIYSEYIKKNCRNVAKLGVNVPKAENSEVVNPIYDIVSNYNEFVRLLGKSHYGYSSVNTFYGYYWVNRESYTDLSFDAQCQLLPINTFGL